MKEKIEEGKILHLTLKKKWFDMILRGEKKEEYREIKMYWATRLTGGFPSTYGIDTVHPDFKDFDTIEFKNGYSKDAPVMKVECKGMRIGFANAEWCDKGDFYNCYIIELGKVLSNTQTSQNATK